MSRQSDHDLSDDDLIKRAFEIYATLHPASLHRFRWVVSPVLLARFIEIAAKAHPKATGAVIYWPPPEDLRALPDSVQLIALPVRVSTVKRNLLIEAYR